MQLMEEHLTRPLKYVFAPDISSLINPTQTTLVRCLAPLRSWEGADAFLGAAASGDGYAFAAPGTYCCDAYPSGVRACCDADGD